MSRTPLVALAPLLPALLALLALFPPGEASAAGPQLFKCVEGGRTIYQQQACSMTSQAEAAASSARAARAASEPAAKMARIRPAPPPASSGHATPR